MRRGRGSDRLTKEEYIQQADAICAESIEKIKALGEPQDLAGLAAALSKQAVEIAEDQLAQLRALVPPEEIEEQVNRAYDLVDQQNDVARQIVAAAEAGDTAEVQQLVEKAALSRRKVTTSRRTSGCRYAARTAGSQRSTRRARRARSHNAAQVRS